MKREESTKEKIGADVIAQARAILADLKELKFDRAEINHMGDITFRSAAIVLLNGDELSIRIMEKGRASL